ncbi:MAG: hypothetical protein BWY76_02103 [bacterium ADurb.Bin429]|nr:MAG: hypothetical protein BWY76_02103 [bacterium ADurb.Bin429]
MTWEEKPLTRPRVIITPEALATLKANLDRCPGKEQIVNFALLTGNAETALAEAKRAEHWLNELFRLMGRISYSHYRLTQSDYQVIYEAESALAHPAVTGELRERLRAKIAARCYMLANADYIPRGAAVHMGNPNMAINRYMGLPLYAQLIADHPMAKSWLDDAYVYTKWKTSYNVTAGGGTFRENPGYATYSPTIFLTTAAIALRNAGYDIDTFEPLKDIGRYFRDIETPVAPPMGIANMNRGHAKWLKGRHVRVLPAFGNGQHIAGGQTQMLLASLTARSDPAYAAEMMQSFYEDGGYLGTEMDLPFMWLYWNPDIAPKPMMRTDKLITGFGGVLRAHSTSPEETYAVLRNGYTQSHWNPDQGTLVFNSRGVCISPATGWGYNSMEQGICRDSRICFGEPLADHEHGRVDTNIVDYGSLPSMGYLLGQQTFRKEWDPTKTLTNNFDWSRQVMLLKSTRPDGPNYLVVRDTTQGASPMKRWWYQWFITKDTNITPIPGGVRATGIEKSDVKLDVRFLEPAEAKVGVKGLTNPPRGYEGWDFAQVSVPQEPDKGYFTVFYPSKGAEPGLGTTEKLAEGVVKITTPESVDYVFCAVENPVVFKDALVEINAYAGAVRIYPDRVLLVNASGQQGSVAYKGVKAEGIGPFEHVAAVSPAKTETVAAGRRLAPVARPEGEGMLITVDGTGGANAVVTGSGLKGWVLARGGKVTYAMTEGTGTVGYKGFYIKGEAPFVCVHEPGKVTLTADGRRRIFQMPIPEDLVPASLLPPKESLPENIKKALQGGWTNWPWAVDLKVDGVGGMQAGWYNGLMTIGLDDGKHIAVISPYTNPPVWKDNAYTRLLP